MAGHTAALHLTRMLKRSDEVVVVTPNSNWNWIPSNIWVGVGKMKSEQVTFELGPIYKRKGIGYEQALATAIHPEGDVTHDSPYVEVTYTDPARAGEHGELTYDYLINATGPGSTSGPPRAWARTATRFSVCTPAHATEASPRCRIDRQDAAGRAPDPGRRHGPRDVHLRGGGIRVRLQRRARGAPGRVRDLADIVYLTNEYELGDFGVGDDIHPAGVQTTSKLWTESLFRERGIRAITGAHVTGVEEGVVHYEQLDGSTNTLEFDFAMLLPPFRGVDLQAFDKTGEDITRRAVRPERVHEGRRRLHGEAVRGVAGGGLAPHLPGARLSQHLRRRHRLRPAAPDLAAEEVPRRHGHHSVASSHRDAVGDHGQARRHQHHGHDRPRAMPSRSGPARWPTWRRPVWHPPAPACAAGAQRR